MRFCRKKDSILEVLTKIVTILGIIFGTWAYFNTVHPVFQKEKRLSKLIVRNEILAKEKYTLVQDINNLNNDKQVINNELLENKTELKSLSDKLKNIESVIRDKENSIKILSESLNKTGKIAELHKLENISKQLLSKYIDSVQLGKSDFNMLENAKKLLEEEKSDINNKYEESAIKYFEKYIEEYEEKEMSTNNAVSFATSLPFDFKIEIIKSTNKPFN